MVVASRFFWRLYASYAVLIVVGVVTVGVLAARRVARDTEAETGRSLEVRARLLHDLAVVALRGEAGDALGARVRRLGAETGTRYTVIAADGTVIADSDEEPAEMDNHGNRPEVLDAATAGRGRAVRFSRTVAERMMYVALTVDDQGQRLGYVRASLPLTVLRARTSDVRALVGFGGVVAALVALIIGAFVARRVTAPLVSMTTAAEAIAAGEYGRRVPAASNDEIGALAGAFNRMAAQLESRLATITEDRSKLLTILGGMVEGVIAVDGEQRIVHLNAAAGRILHVTPGETLGRPVWEVTRVRQVRTAFERVLRGAGEVTEEVQLEVGGEERTVQLHAARLVSGQDVLVGAVLVLHDVTELRRLETVRRDFVANVSHELKTPITAIRGLVDTIVDDPDMPASVRRDFERKIQRQSERLALLVTDLLTLARLESAEGVLEAEPLDLGEIVRRSAGNFRAAAADKGLVFTVDVPGDQVTVSGDPDALELMLNNLLDNAVKYTLAGGTVTVRLHRENDTAVLEILDTGIGIGKEHHDRIFERFYRVDLARSRELGGTGLGLSIVKHICWAHGGQVGLDSALGAGTTFHVRIPLIPQGV